MFKIKKGKIFSCFQERIKNLISGIKNKENYEKNKKFFFGGGAGGRGGGRGQVQWFEGSSPKTFLSGISYTKGN